MKVKDLCLDLLKRVGNKPSFEIFITEKYAIKELSDECKKTNLFEKGKKDFLKDLGNYKKDNLENTLLKIYGQLLVHIVEAPTELHLIGSIVMIMPALNYYLNEGGYDES